jgi:hypothetical protein
MRVKAMPSIASKPKPRQKKGGFLLLPLLIGVLMLFMLYAMYTHNIFHFFAGTEKDRYSDPNAYPWEEGHLYINDVLDGYDMGGRRPPFREQPPLNDLHYTASVYAGDEPRGEINLYITKEGDVAGWWSGAYGVKTDRNRYYETVRKYNEGNHTNEFKGNTAPLKIYKNERGEDKSKLYFISRGGFLLLERRENWATVGSIYVTGWIDRNYKAEGELFLVPSSEGELALEMQEFHMNSLYVSEQELEVFYWGPVDPNKF